MATQMTIELPKETPVADVDALKTELEELSGVKGAGVYTPRGIGPEEIMIWVKLASAIAPLVTQVIEMVRKRRIEKATITLPSGTKIEVDKATAAEIEKLIQASQAKA